MLKVIDDMGMRYWDSFYKKHGYVVTEPDINISKVVELFRSRGVRRVLDLGCGSGRHLVYLAEQGFDTFGIDIADKAIELATNWLENKGLTVNLSIGSIFEKLPYGDKFFDAIISVRVMNHGTIGDIHSAIGEMRRVLRPEGLIFIEVHKERKARLSKKQSLRSIIISPRTLVPIQGVEKGIIHYQFNKVIFLREFKDFRILDFWVDSSNYYCLLGEMRA